MLSGSIIGMSFKTKFISFGNSSFIHYAINQNFQILRRKKSRRSTTKMQFFDNGFFGKRLTIQIPFFQNRYYVWVFNFMSLSDAFMATTKRTQAFAKRQMNVQTDAFRLVAFLKRLNIGFVPFQCIISLHIPIRNRWITSVSWTRNIVFLYQ